MANQSNPSRTHPLHPVTHGGHPDVHLHLLDELRCLNRLIAAQVLRLRRVNFYEGVKDFRGLFIDDAEIDALLQAGVFEHEEPSSLQVDPESINSLLEQAGQIRSEIRRKVAEAQRRGITLPLADLAGRFGLSEMEVQALVICLAPQIDARYEKLYAYLQNNIAHKSPSVDLILGLLNLSPEARLQALSRFQDAAPLLYYGLLTYQDYGSGSSAAQHFLRVDPRIMQFLLGDTAPDRRLRPFFQFLPPCSWESVVIADDLRKRLWDRFKVMLNHGEKLRPWFYLYGREGVGKKTLARVLSSEAGIMLAEVDVCRLLRDPEDTFENLRLILREALLQPCAIYFDLSRGSENDDSSMAHFVSDLAREYRDYGGMILLADEHPPPEGLTEATDILTMEIPPPDERAQLEIWKLYLKGRMRKPEMDQLDRLTANYNLTGGQIARTMQRAVQLAGARNSLNGKITLSDLSDSCRIQSNSKLDGLAQKISPLYKWNDIVLPPDTLSQLQEICRMVKHRHKVFREWGFDRKISRGKGISALFAGPSGTGKTMAAEVIANELGFDLYRIDLSAVVSKYIGETEKNLQRIFSAAESRGVILFFDEADALFGKRTEVRDSHDRYANIEISYLLQQIEQYQGVAILATNLRQNLDEAFTRRLALTIHFPFPDESSRRQIWERIWPGATPRCKDLDPDILAKQFKLSGGNIKNIALAAAFLAAEDDKPVAMGHVLQAVRREYQKMGRNLAEAELQGQANNGEHIGQEKIV